MAQLVPGHIRAPGGGPDAVTTADQLAPGGRGAAPLFVSVRRSGSEVHHCAMSARTTQTQRMGPRTCPGARRRVRPPEQRWHWCPPHGGGTSNLGVGRPRGHGHIMCAGTSTQLCPRGLEPKLPARVCAGPRPDPVRWLKGRFEKHEAGNARKSHVPDVRGLVSGIHAASPSSSSCYGRNTPTCLVGSGPPGSYRVRPL